MFIEVKTIDGTILINSNLVKRVVPAVGNVNNSILHLTEKDTIVVRHSVKELLIMLNGVASGVTLPNPISVSGTTLPKQVDNLLAEEVKNSVGRPKLNK